MFTFPNKGHTLDFFCLSGLSFAIVIFLFCFALFCPDVIFTRESPGQICSANEVESSPIYLSLCLGVKKSKWMLVNNNMFSELYCSWRIQKRCKNVVNVWLKVSLAGLHISDSFVYQRNTIALKKEERFAVLYIKWCLFSILTLQVTSEGATSTGFCTYM